MDNPSPTHENIAKLKKLLETAQREEAEEEARKKEEHEAKALEEARWTAESSRKEMVEKMKRKVGEEGTGRGEGVKKRKGAAASDQSCVR